MADYIGTISFQSNDKSDLFLVCDVIADAESDQMDNLMGIDDGFDGYYPWESGNVPESIRVTIDGDTSILHGWFRQMMPLGPFAIVIYVEYEEQEEVLNDTSSKDEEDRKFKYVIMGLDGTEET